MAESCTCRHTKNQEGNKVTSLNTARDWGELVGQRVQITGPLELGKSLLYYPRMDGHVRNEEHNQTVLLEAERAGLEQFRSGDKVLATGILGVREADISNERLERQGYADAVFVLKDWVVVPAK